MYARWTQKGVPATTSFVDKLQPYVVRGRVGVRGTRAERRHRAPPSRRRRLGSVPSVVPPEDVDAGDVRTCYPATATCPGPRQDPAGRDVPGAPRPDRRHSNKLRYYKHITFI
jgi:hypothetical protein